MFSDFRGPFKAFDENEDNRIAFTRNSITNLLKFMYSFYSTKENLLFENPEDKCKEFSSKPIDKFDSFKLITLGSLDEILQNKPSEEYFSWEAKKKQDEIDIQ